MSTREEVFRQLLREEPTRERQAVVRQMMENEQMQPVFVSSLFASPTNPEWRNKFGATYLFTSFLNSGAPLLRVFQQPLDETAIQRVSEWLTEIEISSAFFNWQATFIAAYRAFSTAYGNPAIMARAAALARILVQIHLVEWRILYRNQMVPPHEKTSDSVMNRIRGVIQPTVLEAIYLFGVDPRMRVSPVELGYALGAHGPFPSGFADNQLGETYQNPGALIVRFLSEENFPAFDRLIENYEGDYVFTQPLIGYSLLQAHRVLPLGTFRKAVAHIRSKATHPNQFRNSINFWMRGRPRIQATVEDLESFFTALSPVLSAQDKAYIGLVAARSFSDELQNPEEAARIAFALGPADFTRHQDDMQGETEYERQYRVVSAQARRVTNRERRRLIEQADLADDADEQARILVEEIRRLPRSVSAALLEYISPQQDVAEMALATRSGVPRPIQQDYVTLCSTFRGVDATVVKWLYVAMFHRRPDGLSQAEICAMIAEAIGGRVATPGRFA